MWILTGLGQMRVSSLKLITKDGKLSITDLREIKNDKTAYTTQLFIDLPVCFCTIGIIQDLYESRYSRRSS